MSSLQVGLNPNFRGFVSIVSTLASASKILNWHHDVTEHFQILNAQLEQQVKLQVKRSDGTELASATFEGQGERVPAIDIFNRREHWSIGPFAYSANLFITIRHFRNGLWQHSKMVGPLAVSNR
jgi:hypothetical protein